MLVQEDHRGCRIIVCDNYTRIVSGKRKAQHVWVLNCHWQSRRSTKVLMALTLLKLRVGGLEKRPCHPEGRVLNSADRGERGQIGCTSPARALILIPRPRYWETPRRGDVRENAILTLHLKTRNGGLTKGTEEEGASQSVRTEEGQGCMRALERWILCSWLSAIAWDTLAIQSRGP